MFTVGQKVWCAIYGAGVVVEIQHASEEVYPVVVRFTNEICDYYTADGRFHYQGNITLFSHPVEVIKVLSKPSIDWSHVKGEYKWLSVDKDGSAYVHENEPERGENDHWFCLKGDLFEVNGLASYTPGTCDWEDSLVKRPD